MKQITGIILILLILAAGTGCKSTGVKNGIPEQDGDPVYTTDELKQDFSRFKQTLEQKTVGLYTDRVRLGEMMNRAEAALTEPMTELQFYRLLTPVVAELRCGHSFLSVSREMEDYMIREALFFPLDVRFLDGGLFVVEDPYGTGVLPGTEILGINGLPAEEVINRITSVMSTDGDDPGRPRYDAERWFAAMYFSHIGAPGEFLLEILPPGGMVPGKVTMPAVREAALAKTAQGVVYDTVNAPYSRAFYEGYALLKIPSFLQSDSRAYKKFLKDFFAQLSARRQDTLILDLRGNYGGTPVPTVELFKYLMDRPVPFFAKNNPFYLAPWKRPVKPAELAFGGRLYVLVDEAGFSMNSFLLSLLKYHGRGTLVGAPSSGGYACSDAARGLVLPNTGLRLKYSTHAFYTAVEGQTAGRGVEPDLRVMWTLEDYLKGRDPVLQAAITAAGMGRAD